MKEASSDFAASTKRQNLEQPVKFEPGQAALVSARAKRLRPQFLKQFELHWNTVGQVLVTYAARRQPFQPNAFGPGMLAAVARRASNCQIAWAVAKRRVNMLQRSRPAVNRRAAIVATSVVGDDSGYVGSFQFWTAIAPVGKVGPIAMPRHDVFTTIAAVIGALVAQTLDETAISSPRLARAVALRPHLTGASPVQLTSICATYPMMRTASRAVATLRSRGGIAEFLLSVFRFRLFVLHSLIEKRVRIETAQCRS